MIMVLSSRKIKNFRLIFYDFYLSKALTDKLKFYDTIVHFTYLNIYYKENIYSYTNSYTYKLLYQNRIYLKFICACKVSPYKEAQKNPFYLVEFLFKVLNILSKPITKLIRADLNC